jgi:pimeloyl-ACP methyl ester carboxylesterase
MAAMHYVDRGKGPAVVLLHGFPLDHRMWEAQIESLSARHRVIAPDFCGFGQSPPAGSFTIKSMAEDVAELIESLGAGPVTLAGLSMGGYVAIVFAMKYARLLGGLILLDTKAEGDTPETRAGRGKMIQLAREKGSAAVGEAMLPRLIPAEAMQSRPALVKQLRGMMEGTPAVTVENALAAMRDRTDQTSMLGSISVPTLVVTGEWDVITPPETCAAMAKAIPGAEFWVVKGSGHMTAMEQPEQVSGVMERFLGRL